MFAGEVSGCWECLIVVGHYTDALYSFTCGFGIESIWMQVEIVLS